MRPIQLLACSLGLFVTACSSPDHHAEPAPDHSGAIANAAEQYREWGVVGPHVTWAPELCMAPPAPSMHPTRAQGLPEDGHKLFALYANDGVSYLTLTEPDSEGDAPIGMSLVKEAYAPVETGTPPQSWSVEGRALMEEHGFYPFAKKGETFYGAGARKDLFVMTKLAPETPGTDAGWVYGTVAPDGTVTSAGLVESCIACHESAPRDRLFGVRF